MRIVKRIWVALAALAMVSCATSSTVSSPSASPAIQDYGAPPVGVPLIYVADPSHAGWYIGVDWSAKPRATVKLAQPLVSPQTLVQAPDGSAFMIPPLKAGSIAFLDRLGNQVADANYTGDRTVWADDSKQVCTLDFSGGLGGQWQIGLQAPGVKPAARPVALDPNIVQSGIIAIDFASCSAKNGRAILVYNYFDRPTEVYVVRVSDGAVLLHQSHPANVLAGISASEDSTLIAEDSGKSSGYLAGPTAPKTTVRRAADGAIVAQLDPSYYVVAFSRDDSLALVSTSPLASGTQTNLALVRLADSSILWHQSTSEEFGGRWVRPGGGDVAFQLGPPAAQAPGLVELVIVHPDGTAASLRLP